MWRNERSRFSVPAAQLDSTRKSHPRHPDIIDVLFTLTSQPSHPHTLQHRFQTRETRSAPGQHLVRPRKRPEGTRQPGRFHDRRVLLDLSGAISRFRDDNTVSGYSHSARRIWKAVVSRGCWRLRWLLSWLRRAATPGSVRGGRLSVDSREPSSRSRRGVGLTRDSWEPHAATPPSSLYGNNPRQTRGRSPPPATAAARAQTSAVRRPDSHKHTLLACLQDDTRIGMQDPKHIVEESKITHSKKKKKTNSDTG